MTTVKYDLKKTNEEKPASMEVIPADSDPKSFLHIGLGITDKRAIELSEILIKSLAEFPSTVSSMEKCSQQVKNANELAYIIYAMGVENQKAGQIAVERQQKDNGKKEIN